MSRSILIVLLSIACASCTVDPISPNIWSLARSDASNNDVFLGGHYTLESCQKAGLKWFTEMRGDTGVLQCRLNCRKLEKEGPVSCEAIEPVG